MSFQGNAFQSDAFQDAVGAATTVSLLSACASSALIVISTWSVYDSTTGPVGPAPVAAAPPVVLMDSTPFRRVAKKVSFREDTSAPIGVAPGQFLPNFTQALDRPDQQPKKRKPCPLDETSAPTTTAPGQFLPNFVQSLQASEQQRVRRWLRSLDTVVTIFLPAAPVAPTSFPVEAQGPSQRRLIAIKSANASSTADPISTAGSASITSTIAYASSSQVVINRWQVYDPTTGPVGPPIVTPVTNFVHAFQPSDIRPRYRSRWMPLPTSCVFAIPIDDLWFESLDVPVRLKTKGKLAESVQPVFPQVVAPVTTPVVLPDDNPYRRLRGKVGIARDDITIRLAPVEVPPVFLADDKAFWRLPKKAVGTEITAPIGVAPGQFLPNFVSQWLEQFQLYRLKPLKGASASATIDAINVPVVVVETPVLLPDLTVFSVRRKSQAPSATIDPIFTPVVVVTPPVLLPDQTLFAPRRRNAGPSSTVDLSNAPVVTSPTLLVDDPTITVRLRRRAFDEGTAAPVTIAAGQFLVNYVSQWGEQPRPTRRRPDLRQLDPTAAPFQTVAAVEVLSVAQWLGQSEPARLKTKRRLDDSVRPNFPPAPPPPIFITNWLGQTELYTLKYARRKAALAQANSESYFLPVPPPVHFCPDVIGDTATYPVTGAMATYVLTGDAAGYLVTGAMAAYSVTGAGTLTRVC